MKFTEHCSQSAEAQVEGRGRGGVLEFRGLRERGSGRDLDSQEGSKTPPGGGSWGPSTTFAGSGEAPCDASPFSRFAGL